MALSIFSKESDGVRSYSASNYPSGYTQWTQVGGYFDGDGSILVRFRRYHLKFNLSWTDSYLPQLEGLRLFLKAHGMSPTRPYSSNGVYFFTLNQQQDVLVAARNMIPLTCKKSLDLQTVAEYLENRITGNESIERLNESVRAKRRSAKIRHVNMPYTLREGIRQGRLFGIERGAITQSKIKFKDKETIRLERETGTSVRELTSRYGVSKDTIYHALKGG